nr:MAG TPA: hypothetical protein [Caudoviricetes sp.]
MVFHGLLFYLSRNNFIIPKKMQEIKDYFKYRYR